jgi:DNA-binding PadR family transcriptional regulator
MATSRLVSDSGLQRFLYKDLYSGFIRLHILHHAIEGPIFGMSMIEELGRHGYKVSPGTMYPVLHGLEKRGLLQSRETWDDGRRRLLYSATPLGRRALKSAKEKVRELFGELFEEAEARRVSHA